MSQASLTNEYDCSWNVTIFVEELDSSYSIRVKDSTLVTTLITDLINRIHIKYNWMEFALWCENKKIWLLPKSSSLSQFHLNSDSSIRFIRRFRMVNIQLPDLQVREIVLDFSKTVFQLNYIVCRKMGIRHYEELSFQYRSTASPKSRYSSLTQISKKLTYSSEQDIGRPRWNSRRNTCQFSPKKNVDSMFRYLSLTRKTPAMTPTSMISFFSTDETDAGKTLNDSLYFQSFEQSKLANSPEISYDEALKNGHIFSYKTYRERAKCRFPWLVSEMSLMEQGIENYDNILLMLRYKYHDYFFFDERYDGIRINQIFNQARWSILSNETECSDDEALILGGIMLQIKRSFEQEKECQKQHEQDSEESDLDEEINTMLDKLHLELLGRCEDTVDGISIQVSGVIQMIKYPCYFYNTFEKRYAEIKDNGIHVFSKKKPSSQTKPAVIIPIKGNEIELRVKISKKDYFILEILNLQQDLDILTKDDRRVEKYRLRFVDKNEFIRWSAACRLLAKSINFTKVTDFQYECNVITNIIDMKRPPQSKESVSVDKDIKKLNLSDFLPARTNKPFTKTANLERLLQFQRSCRHYNCVQSKIAYIKCWLTLRNAGLSYFEVSINKGLEKELLGIGYNRLILANVNSGRLRKIWQLSNMITWNTNWELLQMMLEFTSETVNIVFGNLSECQMFHEYLGGYLFIMMRNSDRSSDMNEKTFRKLTARYVSKV